MSPSLTERGSWMPKTVRTKVDLTKVDVMPSGNRGELVAPDNVPAIEQPEIK